MFFFLRDETKINITELSRGSGHVFSKLQKYGYLYILNNSKPVGILMSMHRFEELHEIIRRDLIRNIDPDEEFNE